MYPTWIMEMNKAGLHLDLTMRCAAQPRLVLPGRIVFLHI